MASEPAAHGENRLSLSAERRVDEACVRFESAWQAGQAPRIEEYLGDTPEPERSALLRELLRLEVAFRLERGQYPTLDEYRLRFPNHASLLPGWYPDAPTAGYTRPADAPLGWPSLPDYEILGELGRGGMGVVYHARQKSLNRPVALKMILSAGHANQAAVARFLAEARAIARLRHRNVVQVHEIGEHDGLPYFTLEYVEGGSLAARLRGRPYSDKEAAELVELLARTLHDAHRRGIVHRDLKPANILLTEGGVPKVADFGLAKFLGDEAGATRTGDVLGTASYMAPEQASGRVKEVGPAADVYALGAVLYELLTGRRPFQAETLLETLRLVAEQPPERPRAHNPRIDASLEAICLKCLEKAPHDRYPSAEALAEDLAAYLRGESVSADQRTAARLVVTVLRESRYTEVMVLWCGFWLGMSVLHGLCCLALVFLLWSGVEAHGPYVAVWVAGFLATTGLMWFCRLRRGPRLSPVERQLAKIWAIFWSGYFITIWMYEPTGGPMAGLIPILGIEAAVAFATMAVVLGGSFYGMALAGLATALLAIPWPGASLLISSAVCSPTMFWLSWQYYRRPPVG